jgi:DNA repair exonuclease SbcCD ATPase subunit
METIIQISDIHIRAGDSQQSRFSEYVTQIDRLIAALEAYDPDTTLIVLLGDIFHDKSKIGPSAQMLAQRLFNGLSRIHTVVIRGNHDYRQDQPDEPDLIKPFFEHQPENIDYYDETGLYQIADVEFGLVAVQDTLIRGAAGGIVGSLPDYPEPTNDESVKHRIALFHGSFGGALLQNGTDVDSRNNYPLTWIKGYDVHMFGDIHVQQVHRAKPEPGSEFTSRAQKSVYVAGKYAYNQTNPWAYAGSLIQQNFGEGLWGHGFIEWNLNKKTTTAYHIRNDVGLVVVSLNANEEPCVKFRIGRKQQLVLVSTVVTYGWFPKIIDLRFATNARNMVQPIQTMFEEAGVVVRETGFVEDTNLEDVSTANVTPDEKTKIADDLSSLNSPQDWITFFTEDAKMPEGEWSQWVLHPHLLTTPLDIFEPPISTKIQDRNTKLRKSVEAYTSSRDSKPPLRLFRLHYLEFGHLLCFGSPNWVDFDTFTKTICLVNGNNGSGKSSLLEIICIALYGESFPSRHNKSYSAAIINLNKKSHDSAYTRLLLSINGKKYWLSRTFEPASKNPKQLQQRSVRLMDAETNEVVRQNTNIVDPWVTENVGPFEHFLLTTIMSQSNDSDFFGFAAKDQKLIIDSLLNLNACEDFKTILKEAKLNHEYAMTNLDSYESGAKSQTALVSTLQDSDIAALDTVIAEKSDSLASLDEEYKELRSKCTAHPEKHFWTPQQDYERELSLLKLDEPESDMDELKEERVVLKDRLAVLKSKRYPVVQPIHADFDELEQQLTALKSQRLSRGNGIRQYDAAEHKAWLKSHPPQTKPAPTTKSLAELQRLLAEQQAEFDTYEIDEEESKPISAKVLAGLKKQHDELTIELEEKDQEIRLYEKELKATENSPQVKALVTKYMAALDQLNQYGSQKEVEAALAQSADLTQSAAHIKTQIADLDSQLKDILEVKYNSKCAECSANPFRQKREQLLAKKALLQKQQQEIQDQLATKPYDKMKVAYDAWRHLYSDKMVSYVVYEKRHTEILYDLKQLRTTYAQKEEEREELEYETMAMTNEYYAIKANLAQLQAQIQEAEAEAWTASAALADLDRQIQTLQDKTAAAYANELRLTQTHLKAVEATLAEHELYLKAKTREQELNSILAAYPHWFAAKDIEEQRDTLARELSSLQAQARQAKQLHAKLEQARTQAQRITAFREVLSQRTATIKAMSDAFDKYTDYLYPTKVGPAIEKAINAVLSSIALPRPIKLIAQWSTDAAAFNWLVQDGIHTPPYEKCSGAQRFFVSLALRFAFSRMGASNMINAQIFLDEGFTACDAETMERVPALLNSLLKDLDYLQTIFLVSHMDTLKSVATQSIMIQRGAAASQLQIGDRQAKQQAVTTKTTVGTTKALAPTDETQDGEVVEAIAIPTKKRGRPKKDAQINVKA